VALDAHAVDRVRADPTLANVARAVDWRLLALFAGLFVVVGAADDMLILWLLFRRELTRRFTRSIETLV
jgi:Na+/H+ antiporter NhaD/arsenite permease-like protein